MKNVYPLAAILYSKYVHLKNGVKVYVIHQGEPTAGPKSDLNKIKLKYLELEQNINIVV